MTQAHRLAALRRWPLCPIAADKGDTEAIPTELHHCRVHDLKWARRKFPLFINSLFNLVAVNHRWHMQNPSWGKWPEWRVAQIERGLERHPAHAREVNE